MKRIYFLVLIKLLVVQGILAQNSSEFFISGSGELPTFNLNGTDIISQQYNFSFGYTFPKNAELFLNMGVGMFGKDSEDLSFVSQSNSFGVGVNLLFPVLSRIELGVELLAAYGYSDIADDINYDHAIYQAGIKLQPFSVGNEIGRIYLIMGVRYRSFFDYASMNSLELYSGMGMRFGFFKK